MEAAVREVRELVAAEGLAGLVGWSVLPEEWSLFSKVEHCEELGYVLPSAAHSGVRYPVEAIEVTGRKLHWHFYGAKPRVRVKVVFAEAEGLTGGAAYGWMEV